MLRNYIVVAFRGLLRHRVHTLINLVGLALGLAFSLIGWRFASAEWAFDRFHERHDRIYRAYFDFTGSAGQQMRTADGMRFGIAPALQAAAPMVEQAVRLASSRGQSSEDHFLRVTYQNEGADERFLLADPSFLSVFDFALERGDRETALAQRNSVVLSHDMAQRLFGDEDPLGEHLAIRAQASNDVQDYVVTGVAAPIPESSSIVFNMILPFDNVDFLFAEDPAGFGGNSSLFVLLREEAQIADVEEVLSRLANEYIWQGKLPEGVRPGRLQPLTDLRHDTGLMRTIGHGTRPPVDATVPTVFLLMAGAVLLMACINFTNLALGRSATRAQEIGVRKAIGARRSQLFRQFVGETGLLVVAALVAGMALASGFLPTFNELFRTDVDLSLASFEAMGLVLLLAAVVSLCAGGYPALVLSGLRPLTALRTRLAVGGPSRFTRLLVGLQLTLSIGLITTTIAFRDQLQYVMDQDRGIDATGVVVVDSDGLTEGNPKHPLLLRSFAQHHGVAAVASVRYDFTRARQRVVQAIRADSLEVGVQQFYVNPGFVETMGMRLRAGRDFSQELDTGHPRVIVSQSVARGMGWDDAVGQRIHFEARGSRLYRRFQEDGALVVGVVDDFTFRPTFGAPVPGVLMLNPSRSESLYEARLLLVRLRPGAEAEALRFLASSWTQIVPDVDFRHVYLQGVIDNVYAEALRWRSLVTWAAACAICIAALGAFALTGLAAGRRRKEIGVRKVLGATVASVTVMLTREFALLVAIGAVVSWPVVTIVSTGWLEGFNYRIDLGAWHFVSGLVLTLAVVLTSAGYQAVRAATARPADSLRTE